MNNFYTLLILLVSYSATYAQGTLDPTFGDNGIVTTVVNGTYNEAAATTVQPDGKILVAGHAGEPATYKATVARYNTDGSLDTTFGEDGTIIIPIGNDKSFATDIELQIDGKIVVGARTWDNVTGDFAVVRLNADGSFDDTFGTNGISVADNGTEAAETLVIQNDGTILLGGYSDDEFAIAKFNTDGSLDTTFGTNGFAITGFGSSLGFIKEIAVQNDGKIVAGGFLLNNNNLYQMAAARFNADGTTDSSFGTNGEVFFNIDVENDFVDGMVIQDDGKIILGGHTYIDSNPLRYDIAAVRLNTDGTFDSTYGDNGVVTVRLVNGENYTKSMILQDDGKAILFGSTVLQSEYDIALVRLNTDGSLDTSFDTDGMVSTDIDGRQDYGTDVVLQPDGKIIASGYSYTGSGSSEMVVARYSNEPLGINENQGLDFNLYPNPANDYVTVNLQSTGETYQVEIVDMLGKTVLTSEVTNNGRIQVSALAAGNYFVKLTSAETSGVVKFVKQ
ncbi:T9SS type A sorting domain-containing protein [Marixanthomonas spongiae]|uniref:Secretion system C-terminal sorting domain-containing protein n=1 Tax=Marixanthomonas spongiae TaxID=2174845 RepID=A0A2U0I2C0_9FLAO|nr:T9SS type A sorting domain-containing protein [Marixanthomonas spongiae]PVW15257.1 hypothetical protein DDV96_07580 [Marixanthomonas spongiae]